MVTKRIGIKNKNEEPAGYWLKINKDKLKTKGVKAY